MPTPVRAALLLAALFLAGCGEEAPEDGRFWVVTTRTAIADMARNVSRYAA